MCCGGATAAAMPATLPEIESALKAIGAVGGSQAALQPLLSNLELLVEKSAVTADVAMDINSRIMLMDHT